MAAEISASVKGKFKMKSGFAPGVYRFKCENIDTTTFTLKEAEEAFKNGFDVIEPEKTADKDKK